MSGLSSDDIIRMAREADLLTTTEPSGYQVWIPENLDRFAALVAAAERNRTWTKDHWTAYEYNLIAIEREACAKCAQEFLTRGRSPLGRAVGDAIRARGNDAA
jgi:hypothetical protein